MFSIYVVKRMDSNREIGWPKIEMHMVLPSHRNRVRCNLVRISRQRRVGIKGVTGSFHVPFHLDHALIKRGEVFEQRGRHVCRGIIIKSNASDLPMP